MKTKPNQTTDACALYARVSSDAQDVDLSISAQVKALRKHAAKCGWLIVREYVDEAKSARTDKRPAFKEMIADALRGEFSRILVWKFSRFARNRRDSIVYKTLLRRNGIDVISINEKIEDTPEGHLLEGMIEIIDQFFSDNMAGDIRRGIREAIERGFYGGGPLPDGYKVEAVQDGDKTRKRLVPDPPRAKIIKDIFAFYLDGMPVISMVDWLNGEGIPTQHGRIWDVKAIYRVLRKPTYAGIYVLNGEVVNEHYCEPLVSREMFEKVQRRLDSRRPGGVVKGSAYNSTFLLAGLLKCSICGNPMKGEQARGHGGTYQYYLCSGRSRRRVCDAPRIPKKVIEKAVLERVTKHILTRENVQRLVELLNSAVKESKTRMKKELVQVRNGELKAKRALEVLYRRAEETAESMNALGPRIRQRHEELDSWSRMEAELEQAIESAERQELPDKRTVGRAVTQMRKRLATDDYLGQKAFLQNLVQRIEIHPRSGEAKIFYTFPIQKLRSTWESIDLRNQLSKNAGSSGVAVVAPRGFEPRSDG